MDTMKWRQRRSLGNVEKSIEEEKEEGKTRPVYIRSHTIRNASAVITLPLPLFPNR